MHWPTKFYAKLDDRRRSYDVILILQDGGQHDRRRSYDVILTLQDGGHSVANLLPVSGLATSDI